MKPNQWINLTAYRCAFVPSCLCSSQKVRLQTVGYPNVNATGLRTALWRYDLGAELPHLAESGHHPTNATLRPVPRGIDCPEKGHAFGNKAKQAASALVFGKDVTLQTHGYDKYKRTLANVILPDGTNVNHTLVKEGWCWWYRRYAPGNTELEKLEKEAREAKKGLWADPQSVPPWEWRKRRD